MSIKDEVIEGMLWLALLALTTYLAYWVMVGSYWFFFNFMVDRG